MKYLVVFSLFIFSSNSFCQKKSDLKLRSIANELTEEKANPVEDNKKVEVKVLKKSQEEKESQVINYSGIRDVLKEDELVQEKTKKEQVVDKISDIRKEKEIKRYSYPTADNFWSFMSEYWLVKNAQELQWDFQRPEYGIEVAFKGLLEKFGYLNKKFKILVVNSPSVTHMALPANPDEYIFVISLPFMRTLDLSKVEISLLLFEDFFRSEMNFFKQNLNIKTDFVGTNFYGQKPDLNNIKILIQKYNKIIFESGFNFQQQYKLTKKIDTILKAELQIWNAYIQVLNKIDRMIKVNALYKNYTKIYPSPELQIQWLSPKKKVL